MKTDSDALGNLPIAAQGLLPQRIGGGQGDIGEGRTGTEARDSRGQGQAPIAAQTVPVPWSDWAVLSDRLEVGYICALYSWPC